MKVLLIYRNKVDGANSIEELFQTISVELRKKCEVIEYQLGARKNLLRDILNIRKIDVDVYHITGEAHYVACFLPKRKTMLTIHDIHHYNSNLRGWKKLVYRYIFLTSPLRSVRQLTTISNQTKEMLQKTFTQCPPITVIENCYNDSLFKAIHRDFCVDKPRLLHIGTKSNKNLPRVIEAIKGLNCELVIIGRLTNEQKNLLQDSKIDYENMYNLSMKEVYNHYLNSDIVAFVSLSEGFGLPIIEGQAVGRVVITSDHQPMNRVAGDAAYLVDAWSVGSIRDGIEELISNSQLRNDLIKRGFDNIIHFSPQSVAKQYYQLYLTFQE